MNTIKEQHLRILVIDDDEVDRTAIRRALNATGLALTINFATNAQEGLTKIQSNKYDAIFLDYLLPGTDGLEVLQEIRKLHKHTPVMIVTSQEDEKLAQDFIKAGASGYIPKKMVTPDGIAFGLRSQIRIAKIQEEARETESALKRTELQLRTIIDKSPLILFILDLEGNIKVSEGAGLKKLGLEPGQTVGMNVFELYKDSPQLFESINRAISGEDFIYESKIGEYHLETSYTPWYDEDNNFAGTIGVTNDVTTYKVAEEQMKKARDLARQSAKAKEDFLANMSHEIRTPMNAIVGFSKLLTDTSLSEDQRNFLQNINVASDTLMHVINDILDLSKIEAGKLSFSHVNFPMREQVESLVRIFGPAAEKKNILLDIKIDPNIPKIINGDPARLNQVMMNLIGNAVKFTERGKISVSVNLLEQKNERITLCFKIKDTGIGIPNEKLESIFDNFSQVSSDTSRKYGGTGLGLTISKRLVELQGGKIKVESTEGEGSVFSFDISFNLSSKENENGESVEIEIKQRPELNILLAEDQPINQLLTQKVLEKFGINCDSAENGHEVLQLLKSQKFDLILMDIQMPEMDGYQTTRIIRTEFKDPLKSIPIIALTAHAVEGEWHKCKSAGMDAYLSKPFESTALYQKITSLIDQPDLKSQNIEIESLMNLNYLHEVAEGSEDFEQEMIKMFLQRMPDAIVKLERELKAEELEEFYLTLHSIKASFKTFGVLDADKYIKAMERNLKTIREVKELSTLLERLKATSEDVCSHLRNYHL